MSSVTILIPARHRLDHEKDDIKQKSSGHLGASCRTLILQVTFLSCPTVTNECRKTLLNTVSTQLGLNINRSKTKIKKANTKNNNPITLKGQPLEEMDSFMCISAWALQLTKMEAQNISKLII